MSDSVHTVRRRPRARTTISFFLFFVFFNSNRDKKSVTCSYPRTAHNTSYHFSRRSSLAFVFSSSSSSRIPQLFHFVEQTRIVIPAGYNYHSFRQLPSLRPCVRATASRYSDDSTKRIAVEQRAKQSGDPFERSNRRTDVAVCSSTKTRRA